MASTLTPLPTITSTALGAGLGTGGSPPGGTYRNPIAVAGYAVGMDSLNFYVQSSDKGGVLSITSTATSTQGPSGVIANTVQRGAIFYILMSSITATCTFGLNLIGRDTLGGQDYVVARASLDGIAANGNYSIIVYPGFAVGGGGPSQGTNYSQVQGVLPANWRLTVSLTATASGGGANITYNCDYATLV